MSVEQLSLRAAYYLRRGRVSQVLRVPAAGSRSRPCVLALDGNFAAESLRAVDAVLAVGQMATAWKSAVEVPEYSPANGAHVRDVAAIRAFDQALVRQLLWLGPERGWMAIGEHRVVDDLDPIVAITSAIAPGPAVIHHARRR